MKSFHIALFSVLWLSGAPAFSAQSSTIVLTANPVFQNNCARCHGKQGKGHKIGPPSLVSGKVPQKPDDEIRRTITDGKGHMPKFGDKLSGAEIDLLVQQITSSSAH